MMYSETRQRQPGILVVLLLVTNGIAAALAGWYAFDNWAWRQQMLGQAAHAGEIHAIEDYRAGQVRLLQITASGGMEFTGRMDDGLEIWMWPSVTAQGHPYEYTKMFVYAYNNRMRLMVDFPETVKANYDHLASAAGESPSDN